MDPALRREKEAFKKRALEATDKSKKTREAVTKAKASALVSPQPKIKKKKKSKLSRPKPQPISGESLDQIKAAAQTALRSNNPHRILKAVMDMMKERYTSKIYDPLTFEEMLTEINLTDLRKESRDALYSTLTSNPKLQYYPSNNAFLFKPALGMNVVNKRTLLDRLRVYDEKGLGGITMSDIREAVYKPDSVIKKLDDDGCIYRVMRQDKEEVIYYSNPEMALEMPISDEFQSLWHRVSVAGVTDGDIEKYLQNVGLSAMQGEDVRKRKAPGGAQKKPRKKAKTSKVLNTHLDSTLLVNYSDN